MASPSRRDALKALAGLAAASCAPGGRSDASDSGDTADSGGTGAAIDTVVIMMMENRTFDHYFGSLSLVEGRDDVDGLTAEMSNKDAEGNDVHPFHLTNECVEDPPHSWSRSHEQFADGACSGFVMAHQGGSTEASKEVMGYLTRADLPIFYALADDNALCQRWFSSVMSSTWPNRIYSWTATSEGMTGNDWGRLPFTQRSIFDQLTEAGVSWRVYFHDAPFAALLSSTGGIHSDSEHMRPIEEFFTDAEAGTLPQVCFVEPSYTTNSDHPPQPPLLGQAIVGTVYAALAASPQWDRCMMVVDYDEHGGFFDHVPPPKAPDDHAADGFDQLGFRVPALVLGPYAKAEVISTAYEHCSVLSHLQDMFGMEPLNQRNEAAAPLWDCLDLDRMEARDPRPPTAIPTLEVHKDDYGGECFYGFHPGQEELYEAFDRGLLPASVDRRDQVIAITDRVMAQGIKLGVVRLVD